MFILYLLSMFSQYEVRIGVMVAKQISYERNDTFIQFLKIAA